GPRAGGPARARRAGAPACIDRRLLRGGGAAALPVDPPGPGRAPRGQETASPVRRRADRVQPRAPPRQRTGRAGDVPAPGRLHLRPGEPPQPLVRLAGETAGRHRGAAEPGRAAALLLRAGAFPRPGTDRALLPRGRAEALRHGPARLQAGSVPPRRPGARTGGAVVDQVPAADRAGTAVPAQAHDGHRRRRAHRPDDDRSPHRPAPPDGAGTAPHARPDHPWARARRCGWCSRGRPRRPPSLGNPRRPWVNLVRPARVGRVQPAGAGRHGVRRGDEPDPADGRPAAARGAVGRGVLDRATVGHVSGDPFVTHRSLLFTIAYEMLGAAADAEDVVQQTWGGWVDVDHDEVRDPRAYLVRMVTLRA